MIALPRLLLLTDRAQLPLGRGLLRTIAECVAAGASHVVVRELDLAPAHRSALAVAIAETGATVIAAHDRLPGATGLHLPAAAAGPAAVAPGCLRGRSCHTRAEVVAAAAEGFDYATLGPYAATESKPGYGPAVHLGAYAVHPLPLYALGGITPENAVHARAAGAYGVAVMGPVMRASDPAGVVAALLEAVGP